MEEYHQIEMVLLWDQIKALDMMSKLDWKVLIPGHGYITGEKAMEESKLYFKLLKRAYSKSY